MKHVNEPEVEVKKQDDRRYIGLSDNEVVEMITSYRSLLKHETRDTQELLKEKIKQLESEAQFRASLKQTTK